MVRPSAQMKFWTKFGLIGYLLSSASGFASDFHSTRCTAIQTPKTTTTLSARLPRDNTTAAKLLRSEEIARNLRIGQAKQRVEKAARREDRISYLETLTETSAAEQAELEGLLKLRESFEETYNSDSFSREHVEFKRLHNEAFAAIARHCQKERALQNHDEETSDNPNVFYLDGPDGATSHVLIGEGGFDPSSCYVANRHASSCLALQSILPIENVLHATAAEALTPAPTDITSMDLSFSHIDFAAYYFDGCGGFAPHIIGMMTAALLRPKDTPPKSTAVGFSLMGGGNKDVIDKEMEICRALATIAKMRGMRTCHVLDEPQRYGISERIFKTEGNTFTSWILLEPVVKQ